MTVLSHSWKGNFNFVMNQSTLFAIPMNTTKIGTTWLIVLPHYNIGGLFLHQRLKAGQNFMIKKIQIFKQVLKENGVTESLK